MKKNKPDDERPDEAAGSVADILLYLIYLMATGGGIAMFYWLKEKGAGPAFLLVGFMAAILIIVVGYVLRRSIRSQQD